MLKKERTPREIFCKAITLAGDDRTAYVAAMCSSNAALRYRVDRLLNCHQADLLSGSMLDSGLSRNAVVPNNEQIGDQIDQYKLIQHVGKGGMGTVYLAQQVVGIERLVALKVIKPELTSEHVIERFIAEGQILTRFNHPGIARVYDAGKTTYGRPYFVMEHVSGRSLDQYVATHQPSLQVRLELFCLICSAVHHAHQKGVIHRDLKPQNILICEERGTPEPKIIDFGIAKLIGAERTAAEVWLGDNAGFMGTPQYMSPEQAAGDPLDTRSDVYALGVLLYELLAGATPISRSDASNLRRIHIAEKLRSQTPLPPSQFKAQAQHPEPHVNSLSRRLFGALTGHVLPMDELDAITLKALSGDPNQRYPSAHDIAADIQRCFQGHPITAKPPSTRDAIRKFCYRNLGLVTIGAILACVIAVSGILIVTTNRKLSSSLEELKTAQAAVDEKAAESFLRTGLIRAMILFEQNFTVSLLQKIQSTHDAQRSQIIVSHVLNNQLTDRVFQLVVQLKDPRFAKRSRQLQDWVMAETHRFSALLSNPPQFLKGLNYQSNVHPLLVDPERVLNQQANILSKNKPTSEETAWLNQCIDEAVVVERPLFFAFWLEEVQETLGPKSRYSCEVLNLLAASLIEVGELEDAKKCLNESLKHATKTEREIAIKMLQEIDQIKIQR